jgi:PAS domain S-box-containing protein
MVETAVQSHAEIVVCSSEKKLIRVLHVDDELGLLMVAKQCLELQGLFHVDTAGSVEEAFNKLKEKEYDSIVSDYQMPVKDGLEFLEMLRKSGNNIPFIMFTGKGREEITIKALNLGASRYLNKTGDPETVYCELGHAIRQITEQRTLETALSSLKEDYELLFKSTVDGIMISGPDGRLVLANLAAAKILGYSNPSDLIGSRAVELYVNPESRASLLQELAEKSYVKDHELTWKKKDGSTIEISISAIVQKDEKGNLLRVEGIIRDISERKRSERLLRESEEKYRELAESISDLFFAFDKDLRYTYWNKASEKLTGIKAKNAIGKSLTEVFPDVKGTKVEEFYRSVIKTKQHQTLINEYRLGDKCFVFEIDAYPSKNGICVFTKDITERKKSECELFDKQTRLQSVFDTSPSAILVIDLNGRIVDYNERAQEIFGYSSKSESVGRSALEPIAEEDRQRAMENMEETLKQGLMRNIKYTIVAKDGSKHALSVTASLLRDVSGNPTGFVSAIEDITGRKKSDESLRESEERFRDLYESIQEPVAIYVGREGRLIEYNKAFKKHYGYTDEELKDKTFLEFVHPEDRAMVLEKYRTNYSEDQFPLIYEIRTVNKKGESHPTEISVGPYRTKGRIIGINVMHRKITERKRMEEELRDSEQRFRDLYESIQDPVGIFVGRAGHLIEYNKAFKKLCGYTDEELKDKAFLDFVHPDDHALVLEKYQTSYSEEELPLVYEIRGMNKKGESIPLEISVSTYKRKGRVIGIEVIHRDLTERKKTEMALKESQRKFEGLFMGSPESAAYLDQDFRIRDINPRFEELFGYSLADVQGKRINDVVVPDDRRKEGEAFDKEARKGYVYHNTVRRRKDRSLVQVAVSAAPITVGDKVAGIVAMYHDISDLKNAEKRLDAMNEKLRVVGSLTRHDARNKLAAVVGNAYLLKKRLTADCETIESLRSIEMAVRESMRIFDFAAAYEKLGVEQLAYMDVKKTVEEAVGLFPDLKGVKIVNDCGGLTLLADSLLRQLFYNLIDDSLKYGEKLTQIRIRYEKSENQLKLVYEDDGVGISQDAKPKLFSEGYTTGKGSGYGLYLIRRMMDVYGWAIDETGVPSKGVQFTMSIPRISSTGKANYQIQEVQGVNKNRK